MLLFLVLGCRGPHEHTDDPGVVDTDAGDTDDPSFPTTLTADAAVARILGASASGPGQVYQARALADIDGNGTSGVLVASYGDVYVFHDGPTGDVYVDEADVTWTARSCADAGTARLEVGPAGDLDANGIPDVLAFDRCTDSMAFVLPANAPGGEARSFAITRFDVWDLLVGHSGGLQGADATGDGQPDVALVTEASASTTVHLFSSPVAEVVTILDSGTTITASEDPSGSNRFGLTLAAGDLDGSGIADLVVADPYATVVDGEAPHGAAYVFHDVAEGSLVREDADARLGALLVDDTGGKEVHASDDLDGDGRPDLVMSAGAVAFRYYVWFEPPATGLVDEAHARFESLSSWSALDVDGDGQTDVALADYGAATYVFSGPMSAGTYAYGERADIVIPGLDSDQFPSMIASAGDVDGDARDDLLVVAGFGDTPAADHAGVAYLFTGIP